MSAYWLWGNKNKFLKITYYYNKTLRMSYYIILTIIRVFIVSDLKSVKSIDTKCSSR